MHRQLRLAIFIPLVIVAASCARVSVDTKVAADGSFTRSVKYSFSQMDMASMMSKEEKPAKGAEPKPEDMFSIPHSGSGVTVTPGTETDMKTITVSRSVAAGSPPLNDITVLDGAKKPQITSTVSVRKLENGQLEYVETLHWLGPRKEKSDEMLSPIRTGIKKALPASYQTTEIIDRVTQAVMYSLIHMLMGPPEPTMITYMFDPDLGKHKMGGFARTTIREAVKEAIPDISAADLDSFTKSMLANGATDAFMQKAQPSGPGGPSSANPSSNSDESGMTPLTFTVAFPGKVVKTNGLMDESTGEVYWSLYAMVIEIQDVKLDLLVDPSGT